MKFIVVGVSESILCCVLTCNLISCLQLVGYRSGHGALVFFDTVSKMAPFLSGVTRVRVTRPGATTDDVTAIFR